MNTSNRLDKRLTNIPSSIWANVARIDELKGQWTAGNQLHPQILGQLKRSVLVTSTGASTRIEGAKLSDRDIENLMRGISIETFADRDVQEVKGYYELLQNVFDSWEDLSLSESTIKHFHKELLKYREKDEPHRGKYKTTENKVHMIDAKGNLIGILFDTTPAYLTPGAMRDLIDWTQRAFHHKAYHPVIIIANFLVEFLQIHPFQDGNGRLSRILTNLLLLKHGYLYMPYVSHEKLIEDNKPEYYIALRNSQKTFHTKEETVEPWLEFFVSILLHQSHMAIELLSAETIEKTFSHKQMKVWEHLKEVQEASPIMLSQHTGIARPTISQIMKKLMNAKKVERFGLGRSTRYRVSISPK